VRLRRRCPRADTFLQNTMSAHETAIHDLSIVPLRRIPDERGTILHMLRSDDSHFRTFGEIYFSTVYQDVVKGWHQHDDMTLNYACVTGRIKLVVYDERAESPTQGALVERFLGPDDYSLAVIPPGLWVGFKGISAPDALVANCATHPHDPARTRRLDPHDNHIPYEWATQHR
jgi:dTDP-4-dehydrorhamnose 3,5-epimerase